MSVCCPFCLVIILSANTTTPRPPPATRVLLITHSQLQLGFWISIILWTPVGVILIFQRRNHGNSVWRAKPGELADCRDVISSSRKQISHNAVIWRKAVCKRVCVGGNSCMTEQVWLWADEYSFKSVNTRSCAPLLCIVCALHTCMYRPQIQSNQSSLFDWISVNPISFRFV